MGRTPKRFNILNRCVWKKPAPGEKPLPRPTGGSLLDLLQYVCENGGVRKVIAKQSPRSLRKMTPQDFLSVLGKYFESARDEWPRTRSVFRDLLKESPIWPISLKRSLEEPTIRPITVEYFLKKSTIQRDRLKRFLEESTKKPQSAQKAYPGRCALTLCLNLHLELPDWVLEGLSEDALEPIFKQEPWTGRHTSLDVRLNQLTCDFRRWEAVEEIREKGSPHAPGCKMTVNDAIEAAGELLQGTRAGSKKNIANADAVRKSYFRVRKNWVRYGLAATAFRVSAAKGRRDPDLLRQATSSMKNFHAKLRKRLA